eukprot:16352489-Heterocapsa_arctica.AAC.1
MRRPVRKPPRDELWNGALSEKCFAFRRASVSTEWPGRGLAELSGDGLALAESPTTGRVQRG